MCRKLDRKPGKDGGKGAPPWLNFTSFLSLAFIVLLLVSFATPSASQGSSRPGTAATAASSTSGHIGYPGHQPGFGNTGRPRLTSSDQPRTDNNDNDRTTSNGAGRNTGTSPTRIGPSTPRTTTPVTINPPENVTVEMRNTSHAIVSWDTVAYQNGTRYIINVSCQRLVICCIADCNFTAEAVKPPYLFRVEGETNYTVSVAAKTRNRTGSFSSPEYLETNQMAPNPPEVRVRGNTTSLTWEWDYPCPYTGPVKYLLEVEERRPEVTEIGECKYSASMDNLVPYTQYRYSLLAVNDDCNATCGYITYPGQSVSTEQATTEAITTDSETETSDSKFGSTESVFPSGTSQSPETSESGLSGSYSETSQATPTNAPVDEPFSPLSPEQWRKEYCSLHHRNYGRGPQSIGPTGSHFLPNYDYLDNYDRGNHRGKAYPYNWNSYPPDHSKRIFFKNLKDSSGSCHQCLNRCAQTKQGVPSPPTNFVAIPPLFKGQPDGSLTGRVRWVPPNQPNGDLSEYELQYFESGGQNKTCKIFWSESGFHSRSRQASGCSCNYDAKVCSIKMSINSNYTFHLRVKNTGVNESSPTVTTTVTTSSGWPYITKMPYRSPNETVKEKYSLHKSYPIEILKGGFNDANGPITDFVILLKTKFDHVVNHQPREKGDLFTRTINKDITTVVYNDSTIPAFFVFGDVYESQCPEGGEVCNKYLEPETDYFFQFLVFSHDKYTESKVYQFRTQKNVALYVLTSLIIILLLLILVIIAGLFIYKKYLDPIIKRGESMELPLLVPITTDENLSKPIPLSEIEATVERLLANGGHALYREFQELKTVSPSKPAEEAKDGFNSSKNRYINILPFDETRVILNEYRGIPNSDYINASYIHGFEKPKEFIACQGPRENEKDDFWRMVWEKNVHVIVMVTKCVESNVEKCCKYWPNRSESKALSLPLSKLNVKTRLESSHQAEGYVYREIELSKGSSLLKKHRCVKHFHYTLWPDMGCPKDPKHMIEFVTSVKKAIPDESSHTVVHCSAGVGRTGTFIGLNNIMEEMKAKNSVDVFQTVYKMRQNRENMVQTQDQYSFLYKCILKHYQTPKDDVVVTLPESIPDIVTNTLNANNALTGYDPYKEDPDKKKKSNNSINIYPVEEEYGEFPLESMSEDDEPEDSIEMLPFSNNQVMDDYMEDVKNSDQSAVQDVKNSDQSAVKDGEKSEDGSTKKQQDADN